MNSEKTFCCGSQLPDLGNWHSTHNSSQLLRVKECQLVISSLVIVCNGRALPHVPSPMSLPDVLSGRPMSSRFLSGKDGWNQQATGGFRESHCGAWPAPIYICGSLSIVGSPLPHWHPSAGSYSWVLQTVGLLLSCGLKFCLYHKPSHLHES